MSEDRREFEARLARLGPKRLAAELASLAASGDAERLTMERAAALEGAYYQHPKSLAAFAGEHGRPCIEMPATGSSWIRPESCGN